MIAVPVEKFPEEIIAIKSKIEGETWKGSQKASRISEEIVSLDK